MALLKTAEPMRKNIQSKKVLPNQFLHFSTQGGRTFAPAFHPDKRVGTFATAPAFHLKFRKTT